MRVVNMRHERPGERVIRVDRKTVWGNPYRIGIDGDRAEVIDKYEAWLRLGLANGEILTDELGALAGYDLACWCAPLPCHADVLARVSREVC